MRDGHLLRCSTCYAQVQGRDLDAHLRFHEVARAEHARLEEDLAELNEDLGAHRATEH